MNTVIGKSDFYARHGITLKAAKQQCEALGLKPSRAILFAANLLVVIKMKF